MCVPYELLAVLEITNQFVQSSLCVKTGYG